MGNEFTLKKVGSTQLLYFLKTIKEASGLGLKETKDLIYYVKDNNKSVKIKLFLSNENEEKNFLDKLSKIEGIEWDYELSSSIKRKIKLAQLGIIDEREELIKIIKEYSSLDEVLNNLSTENISNLISKLKCIK